MRLNIAYIACCHSRIRPGLFNSFQLSFYRRTHNTGTAAITAYTHTLQYSIDLITVSYSILQAFQYHKTAALSNQQAISTTIKRSNFSSFRQSPQLGKNAPERSILP